MQLSNRPGKLVLPFASSGNKNTIPVNSQVGITPGAASLADGFPPLTMTPVAAGGVPPSGLDMNGILYELSAIVRWANAGAGYPYDADFATDEDVAGYPKGARVLRADGSGYWFNTVDGNETDPDSGAADGWVADFTSGAATVPMESANVTLTPVQYGKPIVIITGALTANLNLIFPAIVGEWLVLNKTTGGFNITGKTPAGIGVLLPRNVVAAIVGDGVDIFSDATASGAVNPRRFGVVGHGVADDTAAAYLAHVYANTIGAAVSYQGINKIALQADAQIPMKTSTDFAGCELVILGGVVGSPSFSTFNTIFIISDDDCPVVTVTGPVSAGNLAKGALFPTLGLFDGHGFALLECAMQVPNRDKTGTANYTQSFKVNRNGRASLPLSVDISAHAAAITVNYRKTSKRRLVISAPSLVEGAWNNQRVFRVSRCNVQIDGFTMLFDTAGTFNNVCELISIDNASDISVDNFITTGRPVTTTTGSYCLAINGGADIYVDGMNALTGWGATGCNNINGLHFTRSVINRIDAHASGHNMTADDCDLHEAGMVYGWGGGVLSVKNSRLHRCPAIANRQDYGGTFFGDLVVSDCEAESNFTSTYRLVDLETNPLGASTDVHAPLTISVRGIKRTGKASVNNAEFIPVALKIAGASNVVYSPVSITCFDITCFPSWRFGLRIDTLNMEANPLQPVTRVLFGDVRPDAAATSTTGILDFAAIRTPTTKVRPYIRGTNSENIHIQNMAPINLEIHLTNVDVNAVKVDTASATQPHVILNGCVLKNAASGYANAPIGGSNSGNLAYTKLNNCDIWAVAFDLSLIAAAIGNTVQNGSGVPLLPAGVTNSDLFTGWRKAGVFA